MKTIYTRLTKWMNDLADYAGSPFVFLGFVVVAACWFAAGIIFEFSGLWYDIMDVTVFLTTFFLVFIVQASQNADTRAMQDKLDEIIGALKDADSRKKGEEKQMKAGK